MDFRQILERFWFHGGAIKSFHLDIPNNLAEIELSLKRHIDGKLLIGEIKESELVPVILRLTFHELVEASLFDKFPTQGHYIDFSTFVIDGNKVGISFNVHDSASYVYEKDNWVIKSKIMTWEEI